MFPRSSAVGSRFIEFLVSNPHIVPRIVTRTLPGDEFRIEAREGKGFFELLGVENTLAKSARIPYRCPEKIPAASSSAYHASV